MFSYANKIIEYNKKYYILDKSSLRTVVSFKKDGSPITRYGRIGQGSGEYVFPWDMEHSSELFHELFHFYQAYGETVATLEASKLNRELEAHLAQHYYITQISDEEFNWWVERTDRDTRWSTTRELAEYVNEFGNLRSGHTNAELKTLIETKKKSTIGEFRKIGYDSISYPWDTKREGTANFKYLNKLNK